MCESGYADETAEACSTLKFAWLMDVRAEMLIEVVLVLKETVARRAIIVMLL
jgi:hypothetical protein